MRDGPIRTTIKALVRWRYLTDLKITRKILQLKGEGALYKLQGKCNGCGACCKSPMIQIHPWLFYFKSIRKATILWHEQINGFNYIGDNRKEKYLIFKCTHYQEETGQCDSYHSRPGLCRDYPNNLIYEPRPALLPECSYQIVDPNQQAIRESFKDLDLTEEQLSKLKKEFYIDENDQEKP